MKVLCFGTYERLFPRNTTLIAGLRRAGAEVVECHEPLWELTRDKTGSTFLNPLALLKMVVRIVKAYLQLIWRHRRESYDLMVVGYMGYLDMLVAAPLARWRNRPLVYSPVVSLYETVVSDRRMFADNSIAARLAWHLDCWALKMATFILLETDEYIKFFSGEFSIPNRRFFRVLLGADEDNYLAQQDLVRPSPADNFLVFFYGKFTPLQGVPVIIRAAALLQQRTTGLRFEIVGSGQLTREVRQLADELGLKNTEFIDWVDYQVLPEHIARADVCLGIFGDTVKARRGIPVKVYDALAMGKPIITGDTPAARELFVHGENALLCPTGDPEALAARIEILFQDRDLRKRLATASSATFQKQCTQEIIGERLLDRFTKIVRRWNEHRLR